MALILIIEDQDAMRRLLGLELEEAAHEVVEAPDGEAGLTTLQKRHFDVLITDIYMPEKEGIEVILKARAGYPNLKIIAISGGGTGTIDHLDHARKLGADYVFKKPFKIDDLMSAVDANGAARLFELPNGG